MVKFIGYRYLDFFVYITCLWLFTKYISNILVYKMEHTRARLMLKLAKETAADDPSAGCSTKFDDQLSGKNIKNLLTEWFISSGNCSLRICEHSYNFVKNIITFSLISVTKSDENDTIKHPLLYWKMIELNGL